MVVVELSARQPRAHTLRLHPMPCTACIPPVLAALGHDAMPAPACLPRPLRCEDNSYQLKASKGKAGAGHQGEHGGSHASRAAPELCRPGQHWRPKLASGSCAV